MVSENIERLIEDLWEVLDSESLTGLEHDKVMACIKTLKSIRRAKQALSQDPSPAIANGVRLLNEGYNLGSAIDRTRRDILNEDGYPTISHAKLREALINSVDLLNETGANEIKRVLGFQKRSMAFKIED